jgi:hypothetical protein
MKAWFEAGLTWATIVSCSMSVAIEEASAAALYTAMHAPNVKSPAGTPHRRTAKEDERNSQLSLFRDIIGNPFRPAIVEPAWLAWSDGIVRRLARTIYEVRAFERMPILADALEEAGCDNADILKHCRQPGEHVRGCWVVDLILGMT